MNVESGRSARGPVGTSLPAGSLRIEAWRDRIMRDLVDAPPSTDGLVHPAWAYMGAQTGIGIGVDGILELAGASADDGPMLASTRADFGLGLRAEVDYDVTGEILGLERKSGRTLGELDLLTFRIELHQAGDGELAAALTATWILPRRSPDEA